MKLGQPSQFKDKNVTSHILAMVYINKERFLENFSTVADEVNTALDGVLSQPVANRFYHPDYPGQFKEISNEYSGILKMSHGFEYDFVVGRKGKRLRPYILMTVAEGDGYTNREGLLPLVCAVELTHNATLVHDDIMDKDVMRSDIPTVRERWRRFFDENKGFLIKDQTCEEKGDSMAINNGDDLLVLPYSLISRSHLEPDKKLEVIDLLSRKTMEIIEGQTLDLSFGGKRMITLNDVLTMYTKKTGALFELCALSGSTVGDGSKRQKRSLSMWARQYFNWRFQFQDDFIENNIDGKKGKPVGGDIKEGKVTPLVIATLERGTEQQKRDLLVSWGNRNATGEQIKAAIDAMFSSGAVDQLRSMKREFGEKGKGMLENAKLEKLQEELLKDLTEFVGAREN